MNLSRLGFILATICGFAAMIVLPYVIVDFLNLSKPKIQIADWATWAQTIVSGVAAIAAASAAWAAADASKEAYEANKLQRTGRRAWIKISVTPFSEIKLGEEGRLKSQITISLTNIGRTPATKVRFQWKAFAHPIDGDTFAAREEVITCLDERLRAAPVSEHTILPGDTFSVEVFLDMAKNEATRIAVLAQYEIDGDTNMHESLVDFVMLKRMDQTLVSIDGFVPVDQIAIKNMGRDIAN